MAAGKSTVGRELAQTMGWRFLDTDNLIEEKHGISISEIFSSFGEPFFRCEERDTLLSLIKEEKVVISTGGGMPVYFDNLNTMKKNGFVVYLSLPYSVISERLARGEEIGTRPVAKNKDLEKLFLLREPYYKRAHFVCDTKDLTPVEIANKIKGAYKKWKKLI